MARSDRQRQEAARRELRGRGLSMAAVAAEMGRRFRVRPRTAARLARSWDQERTSLEYRTANPDARIDATRISKWEAWPIGGARPSMDNLAGLALAFGHGCTVADLVDGLDLEAFSPAQRRLVSSAPAAANGIDQRVLAVVGADNGPRIELPASYRAGGALLPVHAPAGRFFTGTTLDAVALAAPNEEGRVVGEVPAGLDMRGLRGGSLVVAAVEPEGDSPVLYGLDGRQARRRAAESTGRVSFPAAYRLDDLTLGVLWAVANFDEALLDDDAELDRALRGLTVYEQMPSSTVGGGSVGDLSPVAQMWLGSSFCADHITRHTSTLTAAPTFWTREQRGEEASAWLLFAHKLDYLRAQAPGTPEGSRRTFCIPPAAVAASARPERVLLFLAVALMESVGIRVDVVDAPEYAAVPGFVTDGACRAIVADWVDADSLWHVDVPDQQPVMREFADALAYARDHSVTAGGTPAQRLAALAGYLGLPWAWLVRRCGELGDYGAAGLIRPRSRLLSTEGVDRACSFVGTLTDSAR